MIFSRFLARMPRKPRTPRTPAKTRPRSQMRQEWLGSGAPPQGVSIRRPPKVCEACEITSPIAFRYARPITDRESERPSSLCRPRFLIPSLCLSPGGGGPPESRGKNPPSPSCWASWVDFLPFPSVLQKWLRKNIEKSVKIEDFDPPKPSQNLSKIPSKSISQKTHDF